MKEKIILLVSEYYGFSHKGLYDSCKKRKFSLPRQIAMKLLRDNTNMTYLEISQEFGSEEHSRSLHAVRTANALYDFNMVVKRDIDTLKMLIHSVI